MTADEMNALRREWAESVFTRHQWKPCTNPAHKAAPGEAGGYYVEADGSPHIVAWLKPTKIDPPHAVFMPRAAHEKIASDVGHALSLPVPPVQLLERPKGLGGPDDETRTCLSLVLYEEAYKWKSFMNPTVFDNLPKDIQGILSSALARNSGMIVLDTYLGQTDRNNEGNVIWGANPTSKSNGNFVFLDYSYSMTYNSEWTSGQWSNVVSPNIPEVFRRSVDKTLIRETADRLRAVDPEFLRETVQRIPDHFLPLDRKDVLVNALVERRELVANHALSNY